MFICVQKWLGDSGHLSYLFIYFICSSWWSSSLVWWFYSVKLCIFYRRTCDRQVYSQVSRIVFLLLIRNMVRLSIWSELRILILVNILSLKNIVLNILITKYLLGFVTIKKRFSSYFFLLVVIAWIEKAIGCCIFMSGFSTLAKSFIYFVFENFLS